MTKTFLISKCGGMVVNVAKELHITHGAVSQWPEELPDSVLGKVARHRPDILKDWSEQQAKQKAR